MNLVTPDWPIEIGGKTLTLFGSLEALKGIQHAMEEEILRFLVLKLNALPFDRLAEVIAIGLKGNPSVPSVTEIEAAIIDEIGILNARRLVGKWLILATTPKADREKKRLELEENQSLKT